MRRMGGGFPDCAVLHPGYVCAWISVWPLLVSGNRRSSLPTFARHPASSPDGVKRNPGFVGDGVTSPVTLVCAVLYRIDAAYGRRVPGLRCASSGLPLRLDQCVAFVGFR